MYTQKNTYAPPAPLTITTTDCNHIHLTIVTTVRPVVSVYNTAGLPMFPFVHVVTSIPSRAPFCPESDQGACRDVLAPSAAVPCDGDYKFVSECVLSGSTSRLVDAVYVHCNRVTPAGRARGVIYNSTLDGEAPMSLLAASSQGGVTLPVTNSSWVRLPLATPVRLSPGRYWVGWLLESLQDCYTSGPNEGSGAQSHEFCSPNKWADGPSAMWGKASPGGATIDAFAAFSPG